MRPIVHRFGTALVLAVLHGAAAVAHAQATPSITECARIAADSERLACYDRAAGRDGTRNLAPATSPANKQDVVPVAGAPKSLIDSAWGFDPDSPPYVVSFYEPNYVLFARYSDNVNSAPFSPVVQATDDQERFDDTETKFQVSFKGRLWTTEDRRWGAWFGYTQQSNWQVFNATDSRPFRETDYMPELFVSYRPGIEFKGFHWRLLNIGFNHQSNGRSDTLSRSWNRIIARFAVERGNLVLGADAWYRLKETQDDNPDITDYYGYGALNATYKWREQSFSLMARGNVSTGKGAVQATWMSQKLLGPLRAYVQAFSGYGESLIDYNWNQTTIGAGVAVNDAY